jgi:hypothetical protein
MSVFQFFVRYDVYSALELGRKLKNVKVGVHDMQNDRDVLSIGGKCMKKM